MCIYINRQKKDDQMVNYFFLIFKWRLIFLKIVLPNVKSVLFNEILRIDSGSNLQIIHKG